MYRRVEDMTTRCTTNRNRVQKGRVFIADQARDIITIKDLKKRQIEENREI